MKNREPPVNAETRRQKRLADALRANLKRRKAASAERRDEALAGGPSPQAPAGKRPRTGEGGDA